MDVLEAAGLVTSRREGRYKFHFFNPAPLHRAVQCWPIKTEEENDAQLVRQWASSLDLSPDQLRQHHVHVVEAQARVVAWLAFIPKGDVCWLDDLWVEPAWIGRRIGTRLFEHAAEHARRMAARRMEWEAERNSIGFYERMGGRYLRDSHPGVWERINAVMGMDLPPERSSGGSSGTPSSM